MKLTLSIDLGPEEVKQALTEYVQKKKVAQGFEIKGLSFYNRAETNRLEVGKVFVALTKEEPDEDDEGGKETPSNGVTPIAANGIEAIRAKM